ncbi:facilitated trehalose transporter Tret1-like [Cotesia glomerata]|uniref:Major facilitator superfamily (MFS) profile domain-containing protein n=1 Tax=Cotesia glomerata TaxID=32391 RepID=A0AAV7J921_COTGL|nr:facilitated trehalose transporter Tret1-like [Cotesia glomerata]KAH0568393.1 hypothetical protein KQX54_020686 [Cotesia glomerata]
MDSVSQIISNRRNRFTLWPQWLAALELFLMSSVVGLQGGWTSPFLSKLDATINPNSELPITKSEASWIASLTSFAQTFGAMFGVILVYTIGSKQSTLITGIPMALSWACFLIIKSVPLIYVSRILSGLSLGLYQSAFVLYIGEISHPKIRGALVALSINGYSIGYFCGNLMGKYLDMWLFATVSLVPTLLFLGSFSMMPHTPSFLVLNSKMDEAAKSIRFYDRNADVTKELDALSHFMRANRTTTLVSKLWAINSPTNRKILFKVNVVIPLIKFSGIYTIPAYMEIILKNVKIQTINPTDLVIIVSFISSCFSLLATYTSDEFGRTNMLLFSSISIAFSTFLLGLNYQLLDLGIDNKNLQWLSILAIVIFQLFTAIGIQPILATILSEMFAPNIKIVGVSFINALNGLFAFASTKSYQPMIENFTEKYVFWIYSLLFIAIAVYIRLFIPETKGKSLIEIQEMLLDKKKTELNAESDS